ncbi:MAG: SBBP repeat-containing protein [Bryobacterales bacterium]|nr:SBBP repeat-containing protein [Bryobacterales bacterium]
MRFRWSAVCYCAGPALAALSLLAAAPEPVSIGRHEKIPLNFEPNRGQAPADVRFLARGPGYAVGLSASASTVVLGAERAAVRISLLGANADSSGSAEDPLGGRVQYFIGNSPERWRTGIPTYGRVRFGDVYPGIDLIYYGNQRQLEYDFELAPGADPSRIRLWFEGAKSLRIDTSGDLVLEMAKGELRHHRPRAYQRQDGVERRIAAGYRIIGRREVRIEVAAYDRSFALTIDPVLSYSTYLGGFRNDRAWGMAVDSSGCAYLVGESLSTNFPAANALQAVSKGNTDVFVTKLNASGTGMVFSTYLGGTDVDVGSGIALDVAGNIYITGYTRSAAFPTTAGVYRTVKSGGEDAFVAKLAPTGGSLVYSTFVGASGNDRAQAIAVDASGNAHIAGYTNSVAFPTISAAQAAFGGSTDAFAAKLNTTGTALVYSTFLGGSSNDTAGGIAVDSSGNAYIAGQTQSPNFPVRSAYQTNKAGGGDAFVAKLSAAGAFIFSTYLGGKGADSAKAIALDASNIYLTGNTYSIDFPTSTGAFQRAKSGEYDAFVTKMNSAGTALVWSTYLGGAESDDGTAIAVDGSGIPYVAGFTASHNFPVSNAPQASFGGLRDAFVAVLTSTASALQYSTYLGGSGDDRAQAAAVGGTSVYVAGYTLSTDFPTTPGAMFLTPAGSTDAFSARLGGLAVMTSPVPGSTLSSATVTFTWAKGGGTFNTYLQIGTTLGGSDLANTAPSPTTVSYTATNMPFNGSTVYVRLWSWTGSAYEYYDYTYNSGVAVKAVMISPTPGSALTSSVVIFTWTPGFGVTNTWLWIGTAPGTSDLLNIGGGGGTSATANLPTTGILIYARLWSMIEGVLVYNDYTYNAGTPTKAAMISPTPGSVLAGASVTFTWSRGIGVSTTWIWIGSAPGGYDLLNFGGGSATSVTANLPTTPGMTIYVRLWSLVASGLVYTEYTYTR